MYKKTLAGLPLWQFQQLMDEENILHFVSGRHALGDNGERNLFNLSYSVGEDPNHVRQNRDQLAKAMGLPEGNVLFPEQTHGNHVKIVGATTRSEALTATDALVTAVPGICIAVLAADCVPILVYDSEKKAIAAIHSGWRGTVSKILSNTLHFMEQQFSSKMEHLKVCIGPSIGPDVYEVGEEVVQAAHEAFPDFADQVFHPSSQKGKAFFNLWKANKLQALASGVPENQVEITRVCTYSNPDQFFSARRSFHEGRFAAGIMLT